jgi:hypothetical protein
MSIESALSPWWEHEIQDYDTSLLGWGLKTETWGENLVEVSILMYQRGVWWPIYARNQCPRPDRSFQPEVSSSFSSIKPLGQEHLVRYPKLPSTSTLRIGERFGNLVQFCPPPTVIFLWQDPKEIAGHRSPSRSPLQEGSHQHATYLFSTVCRTSPRKASSTCSCGLMHMARTLSEHQDTNYLPLSDIMLAHRGQTWTSLLGNTPVYVWLIHVCFP